MGKIEDRGEVLHQIRQAQNAQNGAQGNSVSSSQPATDVETGPTMDSKLARTERVSRKGNDRENKPSVSDMANVIIAVCAVAGLVFLGIQYRYMRVGAIEAKESSASAAEATERNLRLMEATLEEMKRQRNQSAEEAAAFLSQSAKDAEATRLQNMKDAEAVRLQTARDAEALRAQSENHASATLEMARQSLEASKEFFETAQRAQLVIESSEFTLDESGRPMGGLVTIKNVGHLPARDVLWAVCLVGGPGGGSFELKEMMPPISRQGLERPQETIGPGATRVLTPSPRFYNFECPDIRPVGEVIFLLSRVQYLDGFDQERYVDSCSFWTTIIFRDATTTQLPCLGFGGEGRIEELVAKKRTNR